jgi:hypothetical protein
METSARLRDPQHTRSPFRYSHRDGKTYAFTERDAIHVEPYLSISEQLLWNVPMVYTGAGVRQVYCLKESWYVRGHANSCRFGDIYRSARIMTQEEAQRQRIAQRGVRRLERIRCARVEVWLQACPHNMCRSCCMSTNVRCPRHIVEN